MIKLSKGFIVIVLLAFSFVGVAQTTTNTPYSKYGLGILRSESFLQSFSMGGLGVSLRSKRNMNHLNPASYSALVATSFEIGFTNNSLTLTDGFETEHKNNSYINHLSFGFPIMRDKWGMGFGLVPYSNVGYSYTNNVTDSVAGDVSYVNNGNGGLNKAYLTNSFMFKSKSKYDPFSLLLKPFEKRRIVLLDSITHKPIIEPNPKKIDSLIVDSNSTFSFGVNGYFMFGALNYDEKVVFGSLSNSLNLWNLQESSVADFGADFGFQYQKSFTTYRESAKKEKEKKYNLTFGATYGLSNNLKSKNTEIVRTFTGTSDFGTIKDTISLSEDVAGNVKIPGQFGAGISIEREHKWTFGVDFHYSDWGKIQSNDAIYNYNSNYAINTGFEFIPKYNAFKGYFRKVYYRLGARYNTSYVTIDNIQLSEYGITFGVGLPIRRTGTSVPRVNLGIEYGSRGQVQQGLIRESFINLNIGLTINDRWFVHRKYN